MLWVFQLSLSQLEIMLRQQRAQTHKCLHADSESWGASAQTHRLSPDWGVMNDEFMLEEEYPTRFDESCRITEARYINNESYCRHREEMGKRLCDVFCWVVFSLSLHLALLFLPLPLSSSSSSSSSSPPGAVSWPCWAGEARRPIMSFFKGGFKPHKLLWIYHARHFRD